MARKKVRQSLTFDPALDAALKAMVEVISTTKKGKGLKLNGYIEGILSNHLVRRLGKIPTPEEVRELIKPNN